MSKRILAALGGLAVIYCIVVLAFVTTSPDLRIRSLLVQERRVEKADLPQGIQIRKIVAGLKSRGEPLQEGDLLLKIGDQPTQTFLDFTQQMVRLRNPPQLPGGQLWEGADPSEETDLPWLAEEGDNLWARVEFRRRDQTESEEGWLLVQSLPWQGVLLSLVWFVLQLGFLIVGAVAFWFRPFDRPARLFFMMCLVTLGAFVGGFHWWVVAESLWLNLPFVVCAVLVPAVTLHFFLAYPGTNPLVARNPNLTIRGLYAVPGLAILLLSGLLVSEHGLHGGEMTPSRVLLITEVQRVLRLAIDAYLVVAALFFVLTLAALVHSFLRTRNPVQRKQLQLMVAAAVVAVFPLSYTLYLAGFDREAFAFGDARIWMFLASLSFMLAYAVGMTRYKLMLLDQIVSKGTLFYLARCGVTLAFAVFISTSILVAHKLNPPPSPQQPILFALVLMLAVILLLWFRDRIQRVVDRRFFREKYQLDKALQRMNRAVGHLMDRQSLAERMLGSCRDVLRVDRAALYFRDPGKSTLHLLAALGAEDAPLQISCKQELLHALEENAAWQRVTPAARSGKSLVQNVLRTLSADLLYAFEMDGEVAGVVLLGPRRSGTSYSAEDLTFLDAMGQITGIAFHCAKFHQDTTRLNEELRHKVDRIAEQNRQIRILQAELTTEQNIPTTTQEPMRRHRIKGNSPAILSVLQTVPKVAASESSVLVRGESGTGKELLAQAIHENSPRRSAPLVRVHCAALSPSLLESELFGHVKGAFTGAHQDRMGRFEMAHRGTLFLDEIGDISLETQIKLLRVLQERCFEPVGGMKTIHVDVRLITATHQNLEKLITAGRFREDFYYRLNVISMTVPPLRERREDIFELAMFFLNRAAERIGKHMAYIEDQALHVLEQHDWPGNIRELENVLERAVVMAESTVISLRELPPEIINATTRHLRGPESSTLLLPQALEFDSAAIAAAADPPLTTSAFQTDGTERELLEDALMKCSGNKARAARLLGMPRSTYYSKLKKHSLA